MKQQRLVHVFLAITVAVSASLVTADTRRNLARGAKYQCVIAPNYWGWKGPNHGDRGQLTDGQVVADWHHGGKPIYSLPSSIGWSGQSPVIVFDLGKSQPIGEVALHSVLSPWGPWWPGSVAILVSDDNRSYRLVNQESPVRLQQIHPPIGREEVQAAIDRVFARKKLKPTTRWYRSAPLVARGRYVALIMDPHPATGTIVLDEIEILAGKGKVTAKEGTVFREGQGGWKSYRLYQAIQSRLQRDIASLRQRVRAADLTRDQHAGFQRLLTQVTKNQSNISIPHSDKFRAVLPLNHLHHQIFSGQGRLWTMTGVKDLRIWSQHRFSPLSPFATPGKRVRALSLEMAQNAVRAAVLNLSHPGPSSATVTLRLQGDLWNNARLFQVPFTDTRSRQVVCSALLPLGLKNHRVDLAIPSGMTQQVYIQVRSRQLSPGLHRAQLHVDCLGKTHTIDVQVHVAKVRLPDEFSLHLGGWDYPTPGTYQVTAENVDRYVRMLRDDYRINTTWSASALPLGGYDKQGNLVTPPSRVRCLRWLKQYPRAKLYCLPLGFTLANDPHAVKKTAAWARDWSKFLQSRGCAPDKVAILIRDEPTTLAELKLIVRLARGIREGERRFKIWNDIHWANPEKAPPLLDTIMKQACDIQCSNAMHWLKAKSTYEGWMARQRRPSLKWWVYTGGSNGRLTDPYVAFQLRSWFCFQQGLTGAHWWAFGDGHGGFSWNEYLNAGVTRSPLFLSRNRVYASKSMEALREGAQDYELLMIARSRLDSVDKSHKVALKKLLTAGVQRVLSNHLPTRWKWSVPKDRSHADTLRYQLLHWLQ